jgi:Carboxypeptidase regulatory-like domain
MMRRYVVLLVATGVLAFVSLVEGADAVAQEHIKDVDACGLVVDPSGHGVADATIVATHGGNVIATVTSLSDGSFSFMQSINSPVELHVKAEGFAEGTGSVDRMRDAGTRRCGRPVYAVLAVGGGSSYFTTKKKSLPKTK